jgi:hypothetical protein
MEQVVILAQLQQIEIHQIYVIAMKNFMIQAKLIASVTIILFYFFSKIL